MKYRRLTARDILRVEDEYSTPSGWRKVYGPATGSKHTIGLHPNPGSEYRRPRPAKVFGKPLMFRKPILKKTWEGYFNDTATTRDSELVLEAVTFLDRNPLRARVVIIDQGNPVAVVMSTGMELAMTQTAPILNLLPASLRSQCKSSLLKRRPAKA